MYLKFCRYSVFGTFFPLIEYSVFGLAEYLRDIRLNIGIFEDIWSNKFKIKKNVILNIFRKHLIALY